MRRRHLYCAAAVSGWSRIAPQPYRTGAVSGWSRIGPEPYRTGAVSDRSRIGLEPYRTGAVSDWSRIGLDGVGLDGVGLDGVGLDGVVLLGLLVQPPGSTGSCDSRSTSHGMVQVEPAGRTIFEFGECGVVGVDADLVCPRLEDHVTQP